MYNYILTLNNNQDEYRQEKTNDRNVRSEIFSR